MLGGTKSALWAMILALLSSHVAFAEGPFDDARAYIVAGNFSSAMLIIGIGAIGVNDQDEQGYTLLHYAAKSGHLDAVHELLNRGADPTLVAKDGSTPLSLASDAAIRAELTQAVARHQGNSGVGGDHH